MEKVRQEFGDRITFVVLYQREAHAGQRMFSDVKQPETMEERRALAREAREELHLGSTVVLDDMANSVRMTYGQLPNSVYIIDRGGVIVYKEAWARPAGWPDILERLLEEEGNRQRSGDGGDG